MQVTGELPQEVLQRIVQQNLGRFRLCYENALARDAKLRGTVVTRALIDQTGAVVRTESGPGTTLRDSAVVDCVLQGFKNLSFPAPGRGTVTFVYPIAFSSPVP
jgi:hypothetical protein